MIDRHMVLTARRATGEVIVRSSFHSLVGAGAAVSSRDGITLVDLPGCDESIIVPPGGSVTISVIAADAAPEQNQATRIVVQRMVAEAARIRAAYDASTDAGEREVKKVLLDLQHQRLLREADELAWEFNSWLSDIGIVQTVQLQPLQPLAMGHYSSDVAVRVHRSLQR